MVEVLLQDEEYRLSAVGDTFVLERYDGQDVLGVTRWALAQTIPMVAERREPSLLTTALRRVGVASLALRLFNDGRVGDANILLETAGLPRVRHDVFNLSETSG